MLASCKPRVSWYSSKSGGRNVTLVKKKREIHTNFCAEDCQIDTINMFMFKKQK